MHALFAKLARKIASRDFIIGFGRKSTFEKGMV